MTSELTSEEIRNVVVRLEKLEQRIDELENKTTHVDNEYAESINERLDDLKDKIDDLADKMVTDYGLEEKIQETVGLMSFTVTVD